MDALGNEQWQEQKQDLTVISDEGNANEGSQPTKQKPAIAPPRGGSTEEDAKAEEQWQGLPSVSSTEKVAMAVARALRMSPYGLTPALAVEAARILSPSSRDKELAHVRRQTDRQTDNIRIIHT